MDKKDTKEEVGEVMHHENILGHLPHGEDERPWYKQPELRKLYMLMPFLCRKPKRRSVLR